MRVKDIWDEYERVREGRVGGGARVYDVVVMVAVVMVMVDGWWGWSTTTY